MTSRRQQKEAFVWVWLPEATEPVVAGRLAADNGRLAFNYGRSYLARTGAGVEAMALYEPELPLREGAIQPQLGHAMPGCIRDASPDAWGRRVILNKLLGRKGADVETAELDELSYLLESGSDRIGALDFQPSPSEYSPRAAGNASLEELLSSAERVEAGVPLSPELDQALLHGTSIGGARPKALLQGHGKKYVAKFASGGDLFNVAKAEFIAMRLAALGGLDVAPVRLAQAMGRDVLLVERFDRAPMGKGWARKAMVSALTLLGLDEMQARYASYETLAEIVRHRFAAPEATLKELFCRLAFNILCGNTDDHARNHAAFWDGRALALTPAYDICPQLRTGNQASQAMLISGQDRSSQLKTCIAAAHHFLLSQEAASAHCAQLAATIEDHWTRVCDEAALPEAERRALWRRQFLNPYATEP